MLTTNQFNKLSRSKRAIIIAKDVIDQIKLGLYVPGHSYSTDIVKTRTFDEKDPLLLNLLEQDAATILRNPENYKIKCEGCARASLFISTIKFKNKLTVEEMKHNDFSYDFDNPYCYTNEGISTKYLSEEFSPYQQALIETAYEGGRFGCELLDNFSEHMKSKFNSERDKALEFNKKISLKWKKWRLASKRPLKSKYLLIKICENIIKNNGTFKP